MCCCTPGSPDPTFVPRNDVGGRGAATEKSVLSPGTPDPTCVLYRDAGGRDAATDESVLSSGSPDPACVTVNACCSVCTCSMALAYVCRSQRTCRLARRCVAFVSSAEG